MKVKVVTGNAPNTNGFYEAGITIELGKGRTTLDVPKWMAEKISEVLGGNGEVERFGAGGIWMINVTHPFNGKVNFNFDVHVQYKVGRGGEDDDNVTLRPTW